MSIDLGIVKPGTHVRIPFNTFDSNDPSASVTVTNLAAGDVEIHKDGSATQRASDSGVTVSIDFDSITGQHYVLCDTADNTTDGFWAAGSVYDVRVEGITVDAATLNVWVGRFTLGYHGSVLDTNIATYSSQTSFTLTAGSADNDAYNGMWAVIHDKASAVQTQIGYISDYVGSTKTVTLVADPAIFTMTQYDNISIMGPAPLQATTVGNKLDVTSTGAAGIDWGNVENPTTAVDLSATDIQLADTVTTLTGHTAQTGDSFARLGAPAGASVSADIASVQTDTTAIVADTNELQGDWTNGGRLDLIIDELTTNLDAVETDTQDIQSTLAAGVDIASISTSTEAADNLEASAETIVVGTAQTGTLSTTVMTTNLTEATDDHYIGRTIIWTSGVLQDQATDITDYAGTAGTLTFSAVTEAPSNGDTFIIV